MVRAIVLRISAVQAVRDVSVIPVAAADQVAVPAAEEIEYERKSIDPARLGRKRLSALAVMAGWRDRQRLRAGLFSAFGQLPFPDKEPVDQTG